MNGYLQLLNNMDKLSVSEKRVLLCITTYLNEKELDEFENFNANSNTSIQESLSLKNIDTKNSHINKILQMIIKYI